MKNIKKLLPLVFVIVAINIISCHKDEQKKSSYCEMPTDVTFKNEVGRIYLYNIQQNKFYYIGSPDTLKRNGGYIPCNPLSQDLIPESEIGVLVIYSGIVKLQRSAEEPLYFGIEITEIKKAD